MLFKMYSLQLRITLANIVVITITITH